MLPLRHVPSSNWAISVLIARYCAGTGGKVNARDLRAGFAFTFILGSNLAGRTHNQIELALRGQWSPAAKTAETVYLHQGHYNAAMAHRVRGGLPLPLQASCRMWLCTVALVASPVDAVGAFVPPELWVCEKWCGLVCSKCRVKAEPSST